MGSEHIMTLISLLEREGFSNLKVFHNTGYIEDERNLNQLEYELSLIPSRYHDQHIYKEIREMLNIYSEFFDMPKKVKSPELFQVMCDRVYNRLYNYIENNIHDDLTYEFAFMRLWRGRKDVIYMNALRDYSDKIFYISLSRIFS